MNAFVKIYSGNKAKNDIDAIMQKMGFVDLSMFSGKSAVIKFFSKLFSMFNLLLKLKKNDVLLIQYPFKKFYALQCRIARLKGAKTVTLIHDLGTFRRHKLTAEQEVKLLSLTDFIIVHNDSMKDWLSHQGSKVPMYSLEIFDYLSDSEPVSRAVDGSCNRIVYAGGLGERKNRFLYAFDEFLNGCSLDLYGSGNLDTARSWKNIHFKGFKASDDFVADAGGDWGLVWDGDSVDECSGNWGAYLRINNPHKASFYLRAGMPIIVWKESAMADFVVKNKIGIAVESLRDVATELNGISASQYQELKSNAMQFKDKLNNGFFFKKAFVEAMNEITSA
ncbi:MAG: galactofuranosyltransferase [Paludibacteraceae bacterium]|nr:galactofuranosyltransferase [Paludibacteraceae bacterium]